MQNIVIRNTERGTEVEIDGVKLDFLSSFRVSKKPDGPIEIELSGAVLDKIAVDTD